jgi:hypothetical protein
VLRKQKQALDEEESVRSHGSALVIKDSAGQENTSIISEEQSKSQTGSNDQFDQYTSEIYDGLKVYASKETDSSNEHMMMGDHRQAVMKTSKV